MDPLTFVKTNGEKSNLTNDDIQSLMMNFRGEIHMPADEHYELHRSVWNGMIDRKPCIIARCSGTADVISAVKFARSHNLLISIRAGGHHVAGRAVCDDGMVIDLSGMNGVHVDPVKKTARVQGGATLGDVDHETSAFGLAAPLGVVSKTGVAGLSLHGGYGWLTRKHGLSLDNIISAEVVTADGGLVRASADENSDLYWAIRGGGGNFGIITSFEFKLHPIDPKVWLLLTFYPLSKAKEGFELIRDAFPDAPEELGLIGVLWNAPLEDFIPEQYRGKPVFVFIGSYTGNLKDGEKVLEPFRNLGEPIADLSEPLPFKFVQQVLDPDFPDGRKYYWKSAYVNELDDRLIDLVIKHAENRPSPLTSIDIWMLGGKANRINSESTAFYQRNSPFLVNIESNWDDPSETDRNVDWTRKAFDEIVKLEDVGTYMNFPGFGEGGKEFFSRSLGSNYNRLQEVKARYDPDNFFQGFINLS
ncbi:MAG: FAD-binding protein [candidate division Zixibacteria bacterium]|nr:FAD-binding protein [candidate division Zixibacteria bacterium]